MIARNSNQSNYAVFDMDNTSSRFDLEEALIPWLDNAGILTRNNLDPSLKLIPFRDNATHREGLYSYYLHLCEMDELLCYLWAAQVFKGLTLRELKGYRRAHGASRDGSGDLLRRRRTRRDRDQPSARLPRPGRAVQAPDGQRHHRLRRLCRVRGTRADGRIGPAIRVPQENIIGVTTFKFPRNTSSGALVTARRQIERGAYDPMANLDLIYAPFLWTPATWMAGKFATILTYIDE